MTLLALALIAIGFGWLSYKKPVVGLGILLALAPTYQIRFKLAGFPTTLIEILLVVFLLAVFLSQLDNFGRIKNLGKINYWVGGFILAAIISTFVSPEPMKAVGILKAYMIEPVLLFYAVVLSLKDQSQLKLPLQFLFVSTTLISLFGIFQYFTSFLLPLRFWGTGEEMKRIVSVFEYPNALALFLAPLFILFVVLALKNYFLPSRFWIWFGLLVQAITLLLTFSRGAWMATAIIIFFIALEHFNSKKLILAVAGVGLIFALTFAPIRDRILGSINDPSGFARLDLITAANTKIKQSPIVGNGLYGFRATLTEQNFRGEVLNYPHNIILNFWLETGLLGLISFGGIVYLALSKYRLNRTVLGMAAACFIGTLLLHGALDVPYFKNDLAILFWFVVSILYIKQ